MNVSVFGVYETSEDSEGFLHEAMIRLFSAESRQKALAYAKAQQATQDGSWPTNSTYRVRRVKVYQ